jgi:hypothetical protein
VRRVLPVSYVRSRTEAHLYTRNALVVRSATRGPPPSTWQRARPTDTSVAWDPVGRGTGPSSGAQDAKAGTGRSAGPRPRPSIGEPDHPWGPSRRASPPGRSSPTHWAPSLAQLPGEAGSGTHRRTAWGNRPWGHRRVHGIRRGRSCSPSTQEPPVAQPRALNARLGMGGHR